MSDVEKRWLSERTLACLAASKVPMKRSELQETVDVSRSMLQRSLDELESQSKIEWTGTTPTDPAGGFRKK